MCKLVPAVKHRGLAKHHVLGVKVIIVVNVLGAVEPHKVYHAVAVGEMGHHPFFADAHGKLLETQNLSFDLYKRHVALQFVDGINLTPVHIFIWIVFQEVGPGINVQFLAEYFLALGAHSRQVHDVLT